MILSGFSVFVLAFKDASGIEGLGATIQAEKEFEELAGDRGHRDGARHAGGFLLVIRGAVKLAAHNESLEVTNG